MCKNPNYKIILGEKSLHAKVFELWDVICGVAYSPIDEWSLLFYIRYNSNIYYRSYSRFNLNKFNKCNCNFSDFHDQLQHCRSQ